MSLDKKKRFKFWKLNNHWVIELWVDIGDG
jgi:hypothetical protein